MIRLSTPILAILTLLLGTSCASITSWTPAPDDANLADGGLEQAADRIVSPIVTEGMAPGVIAGVLLPDGSTRFFGYGVTSREGGRRPDRETLFAIGSISKGFVGALAAMAVHDGKLGWDDPLPLFLDAGTPLSADARAITIEQLAAHLSGLPRQPFDLEILGYFLGYLFDGENFYRHLDRERILGYLADVSLPADRQPRYSNIGYALLGHVVEAREGKSLERLLAERIASPLGMSRTSYRAETLPGYEARAIGHAGDHPLFIARGDPTPDWRMSDILVGAASLYSNAEDLLAFARAHLPIGGWKVPPALADTLRPRQPRLRGAPAVAWIVDDVEGAKITYQIGLIAGYSAYLAVNTGNRTAVVLLQNAFNLDYSAGHRLMVHLSRAYPGTGRSEHVLAAP